MSPCYHTLTTRLCVASHITLNHVSHVARCACTARVAALVRNGPAWRRPFAESATPHPSMHAAMTSLAVWAACWPSMS